MNPVADCEAAPAVGRGPALLGLARLMKMAFDGIDLKPVAGRLIERAAADAADANALLDLSTVLMLQGLGELGLATQTQALQVRRDYELAAAGAPALRLLAIMAPGDLMTNMPLPFLLEGSGVSLHMLYVAPGEPLPSLLPLHDLVLIAVSESDRTAPLLRQLAAAPAWSRPLCNRPAAIAGTSRSLAHARLAGAPGVAMPVAARAGRDRLRLVAGGATPLPSVLPEGRFPLVVRPVDSHAGHGLEKVDDGRALGRYLDAATADEFFVSRFIDYRDADGLYRKYRVVLVDGRAFPGHMGVSSHWMIHYLNAGMSESAAKRAEEEAFMQTFDEGFGRRHAPALQAIAERCGLDYLVIDCAEAPGGDLLVFEVDPGAVIHAMDPIDGFGYKRPHMARIFAAFVDMLVKRCR